ncbi:uncharacterized protein FOMMEDRAFT_151159 [Fomitiporia mediterranea MF3/22]|uniref:uncharacterized protein n=1 Tax=Fomitiporia mediterranea (strain MF3/22) TaxID=694068 RepID=UPI00044080A4|nr:uncharacterized protein FOMMEDRAFT_151159 [Fomitiporia mediterranea MF3/22]EJD08363.1 hypothetical protein FOMMEDRAFT_151159 [Fomitiporia mediterranea MF3/22]
MRKFSTSTTSYEAAVVSFEIALFECQKWQQQDLLAAFHRATHTHRRRTRRRKPTNSHTRAPLVVEPPKTERVDAPSDDVELPLAVSPLLSQTDMYIDDNVLPMVQDPVDTTLPQGVEPHPQHEEPEGVDPSPHPSPQLPEASRLTNPSFTPEPSRPYTTRPRPDIDVNILEEVTARTCDLLLSRGFSVYTDAGPHRLLNWMDERTSENVRMGYATYTSLIPINSALWAFQRGVEQRYLRLKTLRNMPGHEDENVDYKQKAQEIIVPYGFKIEEEIRDPNSVGHRYYHIWLSAPENASKHTFWHGFINPYRKEGHYSAAVRVERPKDAQKYFYKKVLEWQENEAHKLKEVRDGQDDK